MQWDLLATLFVGLGLAGVMLMGRLLWKTMPKWLIPAVAGLGMLGFQVYSEYSWFPRTRAQLPPTAEVVAEIPSVAFYKPWSYVKPQILQFVAIDRANVVNVENNPRFRQTNLYFFERFMRGKTWAIVLDCQTGQQANATVSGSLPTSWHHTPFSSKMAKRICVEATQNH